MIIVSMNTTDLTLLEMISLYLAATSVIAHYIAIRAVYRKIAGWFTKEKKPANRAENQKKTKKSTALHVNVDAVNAYRKEREMRERIEMSNLTSKYHKKPVTM